MKIAEGVYVHFIPTTKYKTNHIIFRMTGVLDKQTVARRVLVSQMLATANQKYPTVQLFKERLSELYGAKMSTEVSTRGLTHSVDINLTYLKDDFIGGSEGIFEGVFAFLKVCLYEPLGRVAQYQTKVFDIEKENLKSYLEVAQEDTYYYSELQGKELYFVNQSLQISKYGSSDLVDKETSFTAYQEFQNMLIKDRIDIFLVGEFDDYKVLQNFHHLPLEGRQVDLEFTYEQPTTNIVKEKIERRLTNQSILQLGFHHPYQYGEDDYVTLLVFNAMFGGFSHSRLFATIREQEGLAYTIDSRCHAFTGLLEVYAGIDKSKRNQTIRKINQELTNIKLGKFSGELLEQSKKVLKTNALLAEDNVSTLIERTFNQQLIGEKSLSLEEWLDRIDKVRKADVCQVARRLKLQSLFFLEGVL